MLSGVIERPGFGARTLTVVRQGASTYADGIATPGAITTFDILAAVQPVTGRNLLVLTEGQRGEENRLLFTRTAVLRTRESAVNGAPAVEPDRVTIDGEPWIVFRVEKWEGFSGHHWRCWIARRVVP